MFNRHRHRVGTPSVRTALLILATALVVGCEPEPGSDAWCKKMADTPKGDWSMNEATEYAKSCVFKDDT